MAYGPTEKLPPQEERAALLDAVAQLIAKHGCGDYVHGPLHLPSPESFPDGWAPTADGVEAMVRRIAIGRACR